MEQVIDQEAIDLLLVEQLLQPRKAVGGDLGPRSREDLEKAWGKVVADSAFTLKAGETTALDAAWRERGFGDFWAYGLVAAGAGEAMIETGMNPYDIAAPLVIVEEAGGRFTDWDGGNDLERPDCVGSNGKLHDAALALLRL